MIVCPVSSGIIHLVTPAKAGAYRAIDPGLRRDDEERWRFPTMRVRFTEETPTVKKPLPWVGAGDCSVRTYG
jgi:hypothetical protein